MRGAGRFGRSIERKGEAMRPFLRRRAVRRAVLSFAVAGLAAGGGLVGLRGHGPDRIEGKAKLVATSIPPGLQQVYASAIAQLPSVSQLIGSYTGEGVLVSVDGASIPVHELAFVSAGLETDALRSTLLGQYRVHGSNVSSATASSDVADIEGSTFQRSALDTSIAENVLQVMLQDYAVTSGLTVSTAAATAIANQNYKEWQAAGSPQLPIPSWYPAGTTAQDLLNSQQAIAAVQVQMEVAKAEDAIAGPAQAGGYSTERAAALATWMAGQLSKSVIAASVGGVALPVASLPGFLTSGQMNGALPSGTSGSSTGTSGSSTGTTS